MRRSRWLLRLALAAGASPGCGSDAVPAGPGSLCVCREVDGVTECCFGHGRCRVQAQGPSRCECDEGARGDTCSTPAPGVHPVRPRACDEFDPGCTRAVTHVVVQSWDGCTDLNGEAFDSVIVRPASSDLGAWPAGDPLPVVVLAHGASQEPGDYYDLLEHIASNGMVAAAFDATLGGDVTLRANRTLSYLECLRAAEWGGADHLSDRFALVGHSRGGAAVAVAARAIAEGVAATSVVVEAVVALAPSQAGQFPLPSSATPAYFTLQGSRDPDTRGASLGWFDLAGGNDASGRVRGITWVSGATHQRFHQGLVAAGTGELQASLGAEGHWTVARAYVGGFLIWRLLGRTAYRPFFTGEAVPPSVAAAWEQAPGVFAGLADGTAGRRILHDFEGETLSPATEGGVVELSDLVEATVGPVRDLDPPWSDAHRTGGLLLRWAPAAEPVLTVAMPAAAGDFSGFSHLSVRVGQPFDREDGACPAPGPPVDLEVVVSDATGSAAVSLSDLGQAGRVEPPDRFVPETFGNWVDDDCHALDFLRPIRIPLQRFCEGGVDLSAVVAVQLRPSGGGGALLVDDLVVERGEGEAPPSCGSTRPAGSGDGY